MRRPSTCIHSGDASASPCTYVTLKHLFVIYILFFILYWYRGVGCGLFREVAGYIGVTSPLRSEECIETN